MIRTPHDTPPADGQAITVAPGVLWMRLPLPMRRLTLSGLIISGFLGGGILGAWLFSLLRYHALLVPSALTGLTGVGYVAYRHAVLVRQRRAGNGPASQDAP